MLAKAEPNRDTNHIFTTNVFIGFIVKHKK